MSLSRQLLSALTLVSICVALWFTLLLPSFRSGAATLALPSEPLSLLDLPVKGLRSASVGMIVFSDFQCPACGRFATEAVPVVADAYLATGRVLLAFSDFPNERLHSAAMRRAIIAECAGRQGRYWDAHDRFFDELRDPSVEAGLRRELDQNALDNCIDTDGSAVVARRIDRAKALGIRSTPTTFIGTLHGNLLRVTDALVGARPTPELTAILDRLLAR